jgi:DNA helicase-2/ATP-dependent DNA helicase PcrA
MKEAAQRLVRRYVADYRDDLLRVWEVERLFELNFSSFSVTGRADVILDREGNSAGAMAILDYKTSTDPTPDEIHRLQLMVYAAAGHGEGLDVRAAYIHDLREGRRIQVPVSAQSTREARATVDSLAHGLRGREFEPKRGSHCRSCDVRQICRHRRKDG